MKIKGYAVQHATDSLKPFSFERREILPDDVLIKILYCGVCHSDIHTARNDWKNTTYPCVPGHEIIGQVIQVGKDVKRFKVNDHVGVGCLVDSCQDCESCGANQEQYCKKGCTWTYNSKDKKGNGVTLGGYSDSIVVNEKFVLKLPEGLDLKSAGPLLCAGITTYSPLNHWKIGKDDHVGVIGLGGLGHMAVKLARGLGAKVTVITTSPEKEQDARKLGATDVLLSKDKAMMAKYANQLDFIIDTIPKSHDLNPYLTLLKLNGVLVVVGAIEKFDHDLDARALIFNRRTLAGSLIGGIEETQALLNFCAEHKISPEVEMIPIEKINEAYERMIKNDVKYRFVIDMSSLA